MPIYEFQCLKCGRRTELLQKFNDPPLAACPHCGGEVKKMISSPAFQFKGSGFYATDYGNKKGAPESKSGDGGEKGEKSGDRGEKGEKSGDKGEKSADKSTESAKPKESKTEAKPAAKTSAE
ncbi:MAG TPA: zinc ribbon domain-containing protein [Thermoanaerobaculia bacterium]|nr:zinc ribbon domain-containing protein [Thermoanaerobaculia bacterium]